MTETIIKKPSEKVLNNPFDGAEIKDSLGRILRLKKPDILDQYDLLSAMGEDADKEVCRSYAIPLLYIATIDDLVVQPPKSYSQFRLALKLVGEEGIAALGKFLSENQENANQDEAVKDIKK